MVEEFIQNQYKIFMQNNIKFAQSKEKLLGYVQKLNTDYNQQHYSIMIIEHSNK